MVVFHILFPIVYCHVASKNSTIRPEVNYLCLFYTLFYGNEITEEHRFEQLWQNLKDQSHMSLLFSLMEMIY